MVSKGKLSNIFRLYPNFPIQTMLLGNQILVEEKFIFLKVFQEEMMIELEYHHFVTFS